MFTPIANRYREYTRIDNGRTSIEVENAIVKLFKFMMWHEKNKRLNGFTEYQYNAYKTQNVAEMTLLERDGMKFKGIGRYIYDRLYKSEQNIEQYFNYKSKHDNEWWLEFRGQVEVELAKRDIGLDDINEEFHDSRMDNGGTGGDNTTRQIPNVDSGNLNINMGCQLVKHRGK